MQRFKGTLHSSNNSCSDHTSSPTPTTIGSTPSREVGGGELVLIRGLPGSGKSTMAKVLSLVGYVHFEADQHFEVNGVYQYDATRICDAHEWCKKMTRQALTAGKRVVVSNTFTTLKELEPYLAMTDSVRVIEAQGRWKNQHGVPAEMLERMALRWQVLPPDLLTH